MKVRPNSYFRDKRVGPDQIKYGWTILGTGLFWYSWDKLGESFAKQGVASSLLGPGESSKGKLVPEIKAWVREWLCFPWNNFSDNLLSNLWICGQDDFWRAKILGLYKKDVGLAVGLLWVHCPVKAKLLGFGVEPMMTPVEFVSPYDQEKSSRRNVCDEDKSWRIFLLSKGVP